VTGPRDSLPAGPLVAWYGDDFTGSAAVMEVLSFAGLPSVLFLDCPTPEMLARFPGSRGIGIAGTARARSPAWMREHLPPVFRSLSALGAPIAHYKVCSTLDSAPHIGSIGAAIDLAVPLLGGAWHPLLVAAPPIGRYQAFGNLFAVAKGEVHRLDRHPTMARHPVTPMDEADVRRHLARQTARRFGLVDLLALHGGRAAAALAAERAGGAEIVALDVLDAADLAAAGALIWENRGERLFAIGSQGLEYALVAHWRAAGLIGEATAPEQAAPRERIAVVSGSCSAQTGEQIAWAEAHGFAALRADAARAVDADGWRGELDRLTRAALAALGDGRSPLIYTARGPEDQAIAALREAVTASGQSIEPVNERIGTGLGHILARLVETTGIRRAAIAGGDTSGYATTALGVAALTVLAPTVPGAALFKAYGANGTTLELALKGGQMGTPDFFEWIKEGGAPSHNRKA
jgi:uncharacterized protein YgbK (DUF1537 family)